MSLKTIPKTYSLLSIGQRGGGKTVFLAGSYMELHNAYQSDSQALWMDCRDSQTRENIEALLNYIAWSGKYPPPTVKMTNFNFSLKRHMLPNEQTLCHFRWWDIPGESCSFDDPSFRRLVFDSNGCCVFIDADALIHQPAYHQKLQEIRQQIIPIVTLVHLNQLNYAFAFLLTKCDRLKTNPANQLQEYLRPLATELDTLEIDYKTFYLQVPIVTVEGRVTLQAQGTAEPLLWLADKLETYHHKSASNPTKTKTVENSPSQEVIVEGSLERLFRTARESRTHQSSPTAKTNKTSSSNRLAFILVLAGLVVGGLSWWMYTNLTPRLEPPPPWEQEP